MWNEQQSKRVGPFEVKGKTVQYQEKFLLQLMQCQWQSLALDKRGTCTCTGRVTAQGNKDTMTTMVVVIVDDGDHHLDHDGTSPCIGD